MLLVDLIRAIINHQLKDLMLELEVGIQVMPGCDGFLEIYFNNLFFQFQACYQEEVAVEWLQLIIFFIVLEEVMVILINCFYFINLNNFFLNQRNRMHVNW